MKFARSNQAPWKKCGKNSRRQLCDIILITKTGGRVNQKADYDTVIRCNKKLATGSIIERGHADFRVIECIPDPNGGFVAGCEVLAIKATDIHGDPI